MCIRDSIPRSGRAEEEWERRLDRLQSVLQSQSAATAAVLMGGFQRTQRGEADLKQPTGPSVSQSARP
eukprot:4412455-Alexandrium_andersonii.AAC.1